MSEAEKPTYCQCQDALGIWCCSCHINCSPGSMGGWIESKLLNGHFYCFKCFPKMVDVYLAELKLKEAAAIMEKKKHDCGNRSLF